MPLTLVCNASGTMNPPDNIDWFKDCNQIVADKKKRVELHKRADNHEYATEREIRRLF